MRILIEEYQYPAEKVENIIQGLTNLRNINGLVAVSHVGYYFNPELKDTVFLLPKVLMRDDKVFGKYRPEDIIDFEQAEMEQAEKNFIFGLSVWVYRAIVVFRDSHLNTNNVLQQQVPQMAKGRLKQCNTYLDILLALQAFNRENREFFFFVMRNLHSGLNKINWTKTIAKSQAIIQGSTPIYLDPINKKRQINFDEELIVIYYSILNYIHQEYGFPVEIDLNTELITGDRFKQYMKGYGRARLRQIRYKYFSDKALYLWELCFAFFDKSSQVAVNVNQREYLLVKSFDIVFEAIIDTLVGTDRNQLPNGLADQSDGKVVDHLWVDKMLMPTQEQKNVYYIGDSKYYKNSTPIGENSMYKQFTYARNVIQWSYDVLVGRRDCEKEDYKIALRDDETEGYNVIPNFFISADVDFEKLDYTEGRLKLRDNAEYKTDQFTDRLFDRDTMLLSHYNVNFLFVLALYARNNSNEQGRWKAEVRDEFRKRVQKLLDDHYQFYALKGIDVTESKEYLRSHFRELVGKLYKVDKKSNVYSLALEKHDKAVGDTSLIDELKRYFVVADCSINESPEEAVAKEEQSSGVAHRGKVVVVDDNYSDKTGAAIKMKGKYGIGLGSTSGALALAEGFTEAKFLLLHKLKEPIVFKLQGYPRLVTKEQMGDWPRKLKESDIFILYDVGDELPELAQRVDTNCLTHPEGHTVRESYIADIYDLMKK
ncbi:MAG: LlaJI family restriction endonuclease [Bacteroidales bacterium]|nr:LlaJI family restriction endonuclease [Bacteroidales bacterium]